jgi:hypothetical protein
MDSKILLEAKKDIPKYFDDFKSFWDSTTKHYSEKDLIDCYASTLLFKNWIISLNHLNIINLNTIINELHEDINAAFFHSYFGHYRSASMHLRSVIELSLQSLYFYQHEVEFTQWKEGEFRIKHEELTNYLKKHPTLKTKEANELIDQITKNWKKYSKYIHGESPIYFQTNNKSARTKVISKADFGIWKSNFLRTSYEINKLFLIFFSDKLNSFPTINRDFLLRGIKKDDLKEMKIKV